MAHMTDICEYGIWDRVTDLLPIAVESMAMHSA
jgi:hypothetical protein